MANIVTSIVYANPHVIKQLLNEAGRVDFNKVIPTPECLIEPEYEELTSDVYIIADKISDSMKPGMNLDELMSPYVQEIMTLSDDNQKTLEVLVKLLLECGYYYYGEFRRDRWGTCSNGYNQEPENFKSDMVFFDTNWNTPFNVFIELSKMFPEEVITVEYADEVHGSNCGKFTVRNGDIVEETILNAIRFAKQTKCKSTYWMKELNTIRYSGNGYPLTIVGKNPDFDIICLELRGTWKDIWVVRANDLVENAYTYLYPYYQEVERKLKNNNESMFLDNAVNPKALKMLSELSGIYLCYTAYELAVGRWEINNVNTEYDYE